jgi:broad specificity phosphatase PhoE
VSVRLLLVRHGAVDFDSRDFRDSPRGRQYDPPLGERGLDQARKLGARLQLMDPPAIVATSPFKRCLQTIAPFLDATGIEPQVVDDLGEVFIGEWEGVGFEEIVSGNEDLARRFREQEPMFSLAPGAESGEELRARVGVINAYLGHIMGVGHDMFFLPENSSINTVQVEPGRREMRFLNDVRHLTDPALFPPPAGVGEHAAGARE